MIFKPSEITPLGALRLAEILTEAGLPVGLFNVVQGYGDVGGALVAHSAIDKVSLTGSVPTGRRVMAEAGAGLKHVTMELGGKSPLIFDDADVEDAVGGAMLGNFYFTGQVCSNGTRVFAQRGVKERFLARLAERTARIVLGDPLDETTQMGRLVSNAQYEKVFAYAALGREEGARLICGGGKADVERLGNDLFIQPTVFADATDSMRIAHEEIFGPVMCVLDFDSEDEVVARANATEIDLAAGVFARAHRVAASLQAGVCWINAYNLTPVEAPFGGLKRSGVGRENGMAAIEHYTQLKTVYVGMGPVGSPY